LDVINKELRNKREALAKSSWQLIRMEEIGKCDTVFGNPSLDLSV
jgi:hypothetical protein